MPPCLVQDLVGLLRDALQPAIEGGFHLTCRFWAHCDSMPLVVTKDVLDRITNMHYVRPWFRQHIRIPGILGLIDCFLVSLRRPTENEEAFFNHKGYHAVNVQVVSDANYLIRNIRICPGSNNDRHVWQYSDMREHMETLRGDPEIRREEGRYYFLGDSGYTPSPVMLTPIRNVEEGSPQSEYTREHVHTRCKVEQVFGMMTAIWRCIKRERKLLYKPAKVGRIVIACAVLYNFRRLNGLRDELPALERAPDNEAAENMNYNAGILERDAIINRYYRR